jgi:hypothetical protein
VLEDVAQQQMGRSGGNQASTLYIRYLFLYYVASTTNEKVGGRSVDLLVLL